MLLEESRKESGENRKITRSSLYKFGALKIATQRN